MSVEGFLNLSAEQKKKFVVLGVSIHSVEEAISAYQAGATYLTAGHIFTTDCKKDLPPRGLDFLHTVCTAVPIPVYAIGGIDENNTITCIQEGAAGVCMMSSYMQC
jgi:thiamine-phosphate pyrophosphorylase